MAVIADYIVVEQICEECGEVNDHLTTHCPNHRAVTSQVPTPLHVGLPLRLGEALSALMFRGAVWYPRS